MKMSRMEKMFVNSKRHAERNIKLVERLFAKLDLSNTDRALEIGCGVGIVAAHLSKAHTMNIIGTDVDPEQIEVANSYYADNHHLQFMEADATQLPFENGEFDMVLSLKVMHHVPDWGGALKEVSRVLKPKGCFVFADLAFPKPVVQLFRPVVRNYGVYTVDEIICACAKNGLAVLHREKPAGVLMTHHNILFQRGRV